MYMQEIPCLTDCFTSIFTLNANGKKRIQVVWFPRKHDSGTSHDTLGFSLLLSFFLNKLNVLKCSFVLISFHLTQNYPSVVLQSFAMFIAQVDIVMTIKNNILCSPIGYSLRKD